MLHSINHLIGHQLHALDGSFGKVKDFYFADDCWAIRYLIADTGSWLSERQVLLAPHAFVSVDYAGSIMRLRLTRHQIEESPPIATDRPVSRQFEMDFYNYYGLNFYWQGLGIWGFGGYPNVDPLPPNTDADNFPAQGGPRASDDPHLRSVRSVVGYRLHASDGDIGHVVDFLLDDRSWTIGHVVIRTGGWFSGNEVLIPTSDVEGISFADSTMSVRTTRASIRQSPEHVGV